MENKKSFNEVMIMILGFILMAGLGVLAFYLFIAKGTSFIGWVIMIVLLLLFGFLVFKFAVKGIKVIAIMFLVVTVLTTGTFLFTTSLGTNQGKTVSSVVSAGVNKDDLGNIINGQFFFDDGKYQYFSSHDQYDKAHIYMVDKKSGNTTTIFNGFGWSLVVRDNYLYFSGNEGDTIDGSYNLYKMNLDDLSYEVINDSYCYGMSFYNDWLYYITVDSSSNYRYERINVETGKKETVVETGGLVVVVYDKKLYYLDPAGMITRADLDGSNPETVVDEACNYFIIGNGKIVYIVGYTEIKSCDTDGKNINSIKASYDKSIGSVNSYKDTLIYVTYASDDFNSSSYGYNYSLNSIDFDGKKDTEIYKSISYGFYINVIDGDIYALDYYLRDGDTYYTAIISKMKMNGKLISVLGE
ncbi:MAG: DUF5050 domain-containing protein [Clostridia bacterium]|nr:DUF5050 domain-containing protein [Clostridia bacterium]